MNLLAELATNPSLTASLLTGLERAYQAVSPTRRSAAEPHRATQQRRSFHETRINEPNGLYKDCMARSFIEEAERRGALTPGVTVIEATGGSTGSSLTFTCTVKGYHFTVISSDGFAIKKLRTMEAFGPELDLMPSPAGRPPDLIPSMETV
ncbi:uncharacterized protein BO97DRAFT_425500 [Aspergillus homomorphus CBS 101889]|uniref:Tryptophan synthase beta chain-like PALP domain-containing protein n=1 Tax=Aspergillus homomorphus (strain CBS 101889) TaxID=1450537 RepID=A0A395HZ19_ASPHC|nr:hypothetical protein BO97DRAFT_425500 [Aspergillus homomorphus CBS 101889]RAL11504.1 hypothetical protein BO97DRAFT_425500 [Aspergillus homomorphus CBS 101889]